MKHRKNADESATLNPKGGQQTRVCIPQYQNSGTQGPMWGKIIKNCGIKANDKVLIRMKGGCKQYNLPPGNIGKRDVPYFLRRSNNVIDLASSNGTLRNPYGDGSLLYVAAEIEELKDGHYDFQVKFDGTIDSAEILNMYGDVYAR
jgi:hypothetical protein